MRDLDGKGPRPKSDVDSSQLLQVYAECRSGQLTDLGAEQSAALGKTLKARYGELANRARQHDRLWIRTSNVARCVATLDYVLGEMFEKEANEAKAMEQVLDGGEVSMGVVRDDNHAPFIALTTPNTLEWLYPNTQSCLLMAQLMNAAQEDWRANPPPEVKEIAERLRELLPASAYKALRVDTNNFVRVRDYLVSYEAHGLPLPWISKQPDLVKKVEDVGSIQIARYLYHADDKMSTVSARAGVGNLLKIISSAILRPTDTTPVMSIVSAHDTTLMPILSVFRAWDGKSWPGFCSWVAFELYSDDTVDMVFDGKVVKSYTLEEFEMVSEQLAPKDGKSWNDFCADLHPTLSTKVHNRGDHW